MTRDKAELRFLSVSGSGSSAFCRVCGNTGRFIGFIPVTLLGQQAAARQAVCFTPQTQQTRAFL